jgi:benzoate-CoA ligase family protein
MRRETCNAADYLVARHVRAGNGDRAAVLAPGRTLSYADLDAEIRRVARGLRALGIRPEERVAMYLPDDVDLLALILAAMHIGAVAVPCSTMLTATELGELLADCRARVVFATPESADVVATAAAAVPESCRVLVAGDLPADDGSGTDAPYRTWPDSPALWQYTSGTTGTPKAAMHRHASLRVVADGYGREVLRMAPDDRCLSVAKLFFGYGLGNSMIFPLAAGATTILEPGRPTAELFAARALSEAPTLLFGSPSFWARLLASDVPPDAFASVRLGISAGEVLPARMYHRMRDRFGFEILDGLGSTEMLHIYISNRQDRVRPGSSGWPVAGYDVELRDEHGAVIERDQTPGEMYIRGDSAATGYWCRTEVSRRVFAGEWVRTSDIYQRNTDGSYTCLGRSGDVLKASGIWVSPAEVEDRLLAHPAVAETAVVAVPDAEGLEKPVACIVEAPGAEIDQDTLIRWCRDGLAAFKRPRAVVKLAELPRTASGKVRRDALRDQVRHGAASGPG